VTGVEDCRLVDLPHLSFAEGSITPVEGGGEEIPFEIKRAFYLYDVVGGAVRGGHAHKQLEQFIVAVMGGFTVVLWDGQSTREVELNRAYHGLYVPPLIWTDLVNFSSGAVSIVLASALYDEQDYIRDREEFAGYRHTVRART
jgi:dTDP-4-dehydrorhamnose 3,5-epimerase-like enzyme